MSDKTYNGWTNRETWLVNLWLTNDSLTNMQAIDAAKADKRGDALITFTEGLVYDQLKSQSNLTSDLLCASLARVNWFEIVQYLLEG